MKRTSKYSMELRITARRALSVYPTKILRLVRLRNVIEIDHSISLWLYKRLLTNGVLEIELSALHDEMKTTIIEHEKNDSLEVVFVHLAPGVYAGAGRSTAHSLSRLPL